MRPNWPPRVQIMSISAVIETGEIGHPHVIYGLATDGSVWGVKLDAGKLNLNWTQINIAPLPTPTTEVTEIKE